MFMLHLEFEIVAFCFPYKSCNNLSYIYLWYHQLSIMKTLGVQERGLDMCTDSYEVQYTSGTKLTWTTQKLSLPTLNWN